MPPSKHSGSSMSAHKDSDQIPTDQNYTLGDYSFRIERTSVPGSSNDKIEAICTGKDGKNARKSIQVPSSAQIDGWYVEANETEATVYAIIRKRDGGGKTSALDTGNMQQPIMTSGGWSLTHISGGIEWSYRFVPYGDAVMVCYRDPSKSIDVNIGTRGVSTSPTYYDKETYRNGALYSTVRRYINTSVTIEGKTAYYSSEYADAAYIYPEGTTFDCSLNVLQDGFSLTKASNVAWTVIYGDSAGEYGDPKEIMVGRFAIEIEDAGGVGPGSDWTDPGDYDENWEEGDPTHTLYVEVTGALSGRHNDPIEDPSYSYIPADKDTVKDYGCGGDGGHGGGGGAGASTVVIHKFATNQANSKEVTALARRHGYGSGGGKGGKGGDGCILVYY